MDKNLQIERLITSGLVAVIRRPEPERADKIAAALADGGVGALEITADTPEVNRLIADMKAKYGDRLLVGAGTVLKLTQAEQAIAAGADFIFSPNLNEAIVDLTLKYGRISIPGVMTPTEAVRGHEAGADLLKVFPGGSLGASYIKELQGPLGHIRMMPTGGMTLANVGSFIAAGSVAVGLGSALVDRKAVERGDYAKITETARQFAKEVSKARMNNTKGVK
ncbi:MULTISPECIES: bifunctional 4-hydroxy-2-oxoglutarate aldolase/2-dehydro-3-deoxy-phosphogluconate aldolase [unclassified Paenibacillus]|uniref:bifunctional 4-hydroxy-2-oxoglutarate aldolase/2-dehydro-3-deoxy-phosphogluconate aldolase n=1 Tax=unclassified Paenibacillus TaxID=185978 RepID=UPI00311917CD